MARRGTCFNCGREDQTIAVRTPDLCSTCYLASKGLDGDAYNEALRDARESVWRRNAETGLHPVSESEARTPILKARHERQVTKKVKEMEPREPHGAERVREELPLSTPSAEIEVIAEFMGASTEIDVISDFSKTPVIPAHFSHHKQWVSISTRTIHATKGCWAPSRPWPMRTAAP